MIFVFAIAFLHIIELSKLIFFPYPELFVYPYLTNHGLVPYAQILDQHFPGLMFLPVNLDNLGFHTPADARIWQYGIVISVHILLFIVSKKLFKSNFKALTSNFLYLIWQPTLEGWVLWIDSFLPVFYLLAFYFLISANDTKKNRYFVYSGVALGMATIFKQVAIPLALLVSIYIYLKRKSFNELVLFALGYLPLPILMAIYFFIRGTFTDFWFWTVIFNLTTFAQMGRKFASISELVRTLWVFGFAAFALIVFKVSQKVVFFIFMIGALFAVYARFDFVHLQPALPFAVLATLSLFDSPKGNVRKLLIPIYILGTIIFLIKFLQGHVGDKVFFFGKNETEVSEKIKRLTKHGEKIFLFGVPLNVYQMSQTLPAGDNFVFQFPWFFVESQDRVLDGITRDQPTIIVADREVMIQGAKITDYASKINKYLLENYIEIDRIGSTQILRRE